MSFQFLPLAAPAVLMAAAAYASLTPDRRPHLVLKVSELSAVLAMLVATLSVIMLVLHGPGTSPLIGFGGFGFSVRLDAVSAVMALLVAFVGWIVLRYAATYLDGEARQGAFTGWLLLTLAAVLMLVLAGNLWQLTGAWIATSLFLHRLLLFYPERIAAQRAARKKFVTARMGDAALIGAALLLASGYGTSDIGTILAAARSGSAPSSAIWAGGLLAIAAILKSAQFPLHGWLTEVMETPTPVSALLHAGVIRALRTKVGAGFVSTRCSKLL